ncbi:hypothetical protein PV04_00986 [Phialophora macrospora]|uniref:NADP-dependent oxidoreductase domain-containing protein n=1 Tax=Phialophora macrospora TaxID=1851006 RepID=A0A0D2D5C3_9EURO|nr:hypothetical protein PV04_00986 [Phialophora macrospora]
MTAKSGINVVLGTGIIGDKSVDKGARLDTPDEVQAFLDLFYDAGYRQIDTAQLYSLGAPGTCEPRLGAAGAGDKFIVDTKVISTTPGDHKKENVAKNIQASLSALKMNRVNIEYLHRPDRSTPFEETCEAMDEAFRQGKFKHFGLSNYTADEVKQILDICDRRGFVKPTVYQGQYNPIVRGGEKELFPLLRRNGIAFYAWSPAGGGFFAGNYKKIATGGRFDTDTLLGGMYTGLYVQPGITAAPEKALAIASKHGIGGHAAALRWTAFHSQLDPKYDDAVIIGASTQEQLTSNLEIIKAGPLPLDVVEALDGLYKEVAASGAEIPYHF